MIRTLAAGVALAVLVAGAASAAPQSKGSTAAASPKQPIPYSQLDAYLKASPKTRASKDWWSGSASTGTSTDTSATAPATDTSATASTSTSTTTDGSVNPPTSSTMPSDSSTSMPATPPTMPDASTPAPDSNLPGSTTTPGAPTEPK
ncbi:hypothetical protein [Caulobacter sp. Root1472]|uniref:hypothetical protein n=1 Tax=Caulobacter sp. Root1472 TaxID=1736470 RepID=UPI001F16571D|nr:hypothetical protein [Caulobacter sp. Root1472]